MLKTFAWVKDILEVLSLLNWVCGDTPAVAYPDNGSINIIPIPGVYEDGVAIQLSVVVKSPLVTKLPMHSLQNVGSGSG